MKLLQWPDEPIDDEPSLVLILIKPFAPVTSPPISSSFNESALNPGAQSKT